MSYSVTSYGDNPQVPGMIANSYNPDQLIAGNMKIVTDTATITGGAALKRGSALGQVTIGGVTPSFSGAGNGVFSAIAAGPKTKAGAYTVKFKSATTYDVISPNGLQLAEGLALGAYSDPELSFSVAAGGTPFAAGDTETITFAAGAGGYKLATAAAVDGSQTPVTVLADDVDASGGDVPGPIYLMAEVNGNALTLGAGITLAAAKAALGLQNIYVKTAVSAADPS